LSVSKDIHIPNKNKNVGYDKELSLLS